MTVQILDGAIGTELVARGLVLEPPAWSAKAMVDAPALLAQVHADYADAGATLHTANTFRTQPRTGGKSWRILLDDAVKIAKGSVPSGHRVLGSIAPVEDCYRPDLSPGAAAKPEHEAIARALCESGCDALLCETFAHPGEARAAAEAAVATGLPTWLSLTAGPFGDLLSPQALFDIASDCASVGVERILVNCTAANDTLRYVDAIASLDLPVGVYANAGREEDALGWGAAGPRAAEAYADLAERWAAAGATTIGGCCGTSPVHIRALAERFA